MMYAPYKCDLRRMQLSVWEMDKMFGQGCLRTDLKTTSIKKHNFEYEFNVLFNMIWFSSDWIAVSILLQFFSAVFVFLCSWVCFVCVQM